VLDLAWKNMWQRKLRTTLTLLGIAVGLELVILLTAIVDFTEQSMDNELAKYAGAGQLFVASQPPSGSGGHEFPPVNSTIREDDANQIIVEFQDQVDDSRTTPVLFRELAGPPFPNAPSEALAVGVHYERVQAYLGDEARLDPSGYPPDDPLLAEGNLPAFSGREANEVILGDLAAGVFDDPLVGAEITVAGRTLLVVGRVEGDDELDRVASNPVLMPLKTAQEIFQQPSSVSALLVTAAQPEDVGSLAEGIRQETPDLAVITEAEIAESLNDALSDQRGFFNIISGTVYAVAAIVVAIVMVMAVTERTREIGTLRAIGAGKLLVLGTIVSEAAIVGLLGGLISIPVAFLLDIIVGFGLREVVEVASLAQIVLVVTVLSAAAALLPAWRATAISPVEALRYE
jgi:putative ABC transport system permease protein